MLLSYGQGLLFNKDHNFYIDGVRSDIDLKVEKLLINETDVDEVVVKAMQDKQINHLDNVLKTLREAKKHNREFNTREKVYIVVVCGKLVHLVELDSTIVNCKGYEEFVQDLALKGPNKDKLVDSRSDIDFTLLESFVSAVPAFVRISKCYILSWYFDQSNTVKVDKGSLSAWMSQSQNWSMRCRSGLAPFKGKRVPVESFRGSRGESAIRFKF